MFKFLKIEPVLLCSKEQNFSCCMKLKALLSKLYENSLFYLEMIDITIKKDDKTNSNALLFHTQHSALLRSRFD